MNRITLLGLAAAAALATAGAALAAAPPVVEKPIAVGAMKATAIEATTGRAVLESITVSPGGSFGWHEHGASVAVVVTGGTLTVFDPMVKGCAPFKVSKGQSFVEPAHHVHLARNDGTAPVTLYALYLGVPRSSPINLPERTPAGCPA